MVNGIIDHTGKIKGMRSGDNKVKMKIKRIIGVPYICTVRERGLLAKKCYSFNEIDRFECDGRAFAYSSKNSVLFVLPNPKGHPMPSMEAIRKKIETLEDFKKNKKNGE